ncbi:MAG TPA: helix-turn-helix transcriptional regulator [Allosphingosinicella sp.]|jgi:transcriptional regulator with XRE-family HTH domain
MAELPNRIREIRKAKGRAWTLEKLALEVGLSIAYISQLELGKKSLDLDHMIAIARALDVAPGDLLNQEHNSRALSPDEMALLDRYRRATPEQRAQIDRMAEILVPAPIRRSRAA